MGAWGSGLYTNDSTCDVRDSYIRYLQEGSGNKEAYKKTLDEYNELLGDQDEPFLWFALAETQWKTGRLLTEVKEKALMWIEQDGGIELWAESANGGSGWKKTLQNLKIKLNSPMPSEKKIHKPIVINNNFWDVNDVYAYRFNGADAEVQGLSGKYMLIQKIGEGIEESSNEPMMRIQVMDRIFDELPTLEDITGVRILPLDFPKRVDMSEDPVWMSAYIFMFKKSDYPVKHLTFIGNQKGPANKEINKRVLTWGNIDTWLLKFYHLWNGLKYETIHEGMYRYRQSLSNHEY